MQINYQAMEAVMLVRRIRGRIPSRAFERMVKEEVRMARLREEVEKSLKALPSRDAKVLCLHYGLQGFTAMSDYDISQLIGEKSAERVRQIRRRAMRCLQKNRDIMMLRYPLFV